MRFAVDLTGVKRLDWELGLHGIGVVKLHPDIEFDAADGAVFTCCEVELARAGALAARRAGVNLFARFWAVDDDGARRLLVEMSGDYDVE